MRKVPPLILLVFISLSPLPGSPAPSSFTTFLYQSFDAPGIPAGWSVHRLAGATALWTVVSAGTNPPVSPYAGTGMAKFNSYDAPVNEAARLISPRVNLSTATDPFVEFQMYHDEEFATSYDSLYVDVTTSMDSIGGPWTTIAGFRRPSFQNGWTHTAISLRGLGGTGGIVVGIRGVSKFGNNMFLDEFRIRDSSFHDIGILSLQNTPGPIVFATSQVVPEDQRSREEQQSERMGIIRTDGSSPTIWATVKNFGTFPESSYFVVWTLDGEFQPPVKNSRILPVDGVDTVLLPLPALMPGDYSISAWTFLDPDINTANDSANIVLTINDFETLFTETFNDTTWPPSGWTTVNRDVGPLTPWFRGFPGSAFPPFEGAGFAGNNFQRANGAYLDDYLITPAIASLNQSGMVDSLVFHVRSVLNPPPQSNYPDSLMVLVSTTGNDTSSFTTILDYFEVPKIGWLERSYDLSSSVPRNSTVHIAFRYLHYAGGSAGINSDFLGVDLVQVRRRIITSSSHASALPSSFRLEQNYPNPFNPATSISYELPVATHVRLQLFSILGQLVMTMVDQYQPAGRHSVGLNSGSLGSGMYIYRLETPSFRSHRSLIILR